MRLWNSGITIGRSTRRSGCCVCAAGTCLAWFAELFYGGCSAMWMGRSTGLTSVFKLTNATELEERAWLLTHIAQLRLEMGKFELADEILTQALQIFPDYYFTLDALAQTRSAEGKVRRGGGAVAPRAEDCATSETSICLGDGAESRRVMRRRRIGRSPHSSVRLSRLRLNRTTRIASSIYYYTD